MFPSGQALLKALYLASFEATKKWSQPIHNRGQTYGEMCIMYRGAACLTDLKNQQYFIFKKINSNCQLLAGYTHINTFYRSLLNLQKGLHSLVYDIKQLFIALQIKHCTSSSRCQPFNIVLYIACPTLADGEKITPKKGKTLPGRSRFIAGQNRQRRGRTGARCRCLFFRFFCIRQTASAGTMLIIFTEKTHRQPVLFRWQ